MYNLADFGSYTVGGRAIGVAEQAKREIFFTPATSFTYDPNGTYLIEHAYVQYFVPAARNTLPPVVLMHGGGMSGSVWETTPDGRPGWLHLLLQQGFEVHVVDGVERGRSGWCAVEGAWPDKAIARTMQEAWTLFRFGPKERYAKRDAFPGQKFPVASFELFARCFVPRWTSTTEAATAAFENVLERLGRAIIICHSQGGEIAFEASMRNPNRVAGIIGVEPSGFGTNAEALTATPVLLLYGDYQDAAPSVPDLMSKGQAWASEFASTGGAADIIDLSAHGVAGNSHMLMMDANSDDVLQRVIGWIKTKIEK